MTQIGFPKPVSVKKKRKGIRKIGKRGKINLEANRKLKEQYYEIGIRDCEIQLPNCVKRSWLSFVHRHKRREYYGKEEMLSNIKQVLLGCIPCHSVLEKDSELTEKVFLRLRGEDNL